MTKKELVKGVEGAEPGTSATLNFKDKKNDDQNRVEGVSDDPF